MSDNFSNPKTSQVWLLLAWDYNDLTRVTSPPNSNTGSSRLIFSVRFSYLLFIFYLPRCTLPDFPTVSSLASLLCLSCHHINNIKVYDLSNDMISLTKINFTFFVMLTLFIPLVKTVNSTSSQEAFHT